jgi:DHA2 family multidrug resistance protein
MMFMLERNSQTMHAHLTQFANPLNHALHGPGVSKIWNLGTLAGRAALDVEIRRQAAIVAYMDNYRLMAFLALAAVPLALLLKLAKAQGSTGEVAVAME